MNSRCCVLSSIMKDTAIYNIRISKLVWFRLAALQGLYGLWKVIEVENTRPGKFWERDHIL